MAKKQQKTLLEKAKAALEHNNLDEAERLYSQVTGETDRDSEIFKQAIDGIWEVRRRREEQGSTDAEQTDPYRTTPLEKSSAENEAKAPAALVETLPPSEREAQPSGDDHAEAAFASGNGRESDLDNQQQTPSPVAESDPAKDRAGAIEEQVQRLSAQADSHLQTRTRDNYKAAIAAYERILGFGRDLSIEQREIYDRRLEQARNDYEGFLAEFGELSTARQLAKGEEELVAIRKLMNRGYQEDDQGQDLAAQFASLQSLVQQNLLKRASEQAETARKQAEDGIAYLEENQLGAAAEKINGAIALIEGKDITSEQAPDARETQEAIAGIQNILKQQEQVRETSQKYEQQRERYQSLHKTVKRIVPLYERAEAHFKKRAYADAINELESIQSRAGEQFQSAMVDSLHERAHRLWEEHTVARARQLLSEARAAQHRGDQKTVQSKINEIIGLEPSLKSDALEALRRDAENIQKEIGQIEQEFAERVKQAREDLNRGEFGEARKTLQGVLDERPGHETARKLLDTVLNRAAQAVLSEADEALAHADEEQLETCRTRLQAQRNGIKEIDNRVTRGNLEERIEETLLQVEQTINDLQEQRQREEQVKSLLVRAQSLLENQNFSEAQRVLDEAMQLKPGDPDAENLWQEIRFDWSRSLREQARSYLGRGRGKEKDAPNPRAALETLDKLFSLGMEDAATRDLQRQARQLLNREEGKTYLDQDNYRAAIDAFLQADPRDPEVISNLRTARLKEGKRLVQQKRWDDVLAVLPQRTDATNPEFAEMISQAQAESVLIKARTALNEGNLDEASNHLDDAEAIGYSGIQERVRETRKQIEQRRAEELLSEVQDEITARNFEAAENKLVQVERLSLDDMGARVAALREKKRKIQKVYQNIQIFEKEAEDHYKNYQQMGNPDELLKAISILDKILKRPDMQDSEMESLRSSIEDRRSAYQRSISGERSEMLRKAAQEQNEGTVEGLRQASRLYNAVLDMVPDRHDPDAEAGMNEVRQKLRSLRDNLVERTRTLLNMETSSGQPRGILPTQVKALLDEINNLREATQQIDPTAQRELSEEQVAVQEAQKIFVRAEDDLNSICTIWAEQRNDGNVNFNQVREKIQGIVGSFRSHGYTHLELDWNSPENIIHRCDNDRKAFEEINAALKGIDEALDKNQREKIVEQFGKLAKAEETVQNTTEVLSRRVPGLIVPRTTPERCPRQHEFLQKLAETIRTLAQKEKEETSIERLREIIQQKKFHQSLLETLDRDNRFDLRDRNLEESIDLHTLEEWQKTREEGETLFAEARNLHKQAIEAGEEKRWNDGIEMFKQSRSTYDTARHKFERIADTSETPYQAVHGLQKDVQEMLKQAQAEIETLDSQEPWKHYEQNTREALELYDQARVALREGNFAEAIEFAENAIDKDPVLEENARKVVRYAIEERESPTFPTGIIVLVVLAIVIVLIIVFAGPLVWSWFAEFFFPPAATFFVIPVSPF